MTPTFLFIMWMCNTADNPTCPIWNSTNHMVIIEPAKDRRACKALWAENEAVSDPKGLKAQYRCQPIGEDL